MKNIIDGIRQGLRSHRLLTDLVGIDKDGEVKVYEERAKLDVPPPYVVWHIVPGGDILRAYGDAEAVQEVPLQISSWADEAKVAWQIAEAVDDAIKEVDFPVAPWEFMGVLRTAFPQPLPDRDTPLYQIAVPYVMRLSSAGRVR